MNLHTSTISHALNALLLAVALMLGANATAKADDPSWWPGFYGPLDDGVGLCSLMYQDKLVVGGTFNGLGGFQTPYLAMHDGQRWRLLDGAFNDRVCALIEHDGVLFATGAFTHVNDVEVNGVAAYVNQQWLPLGEGIDGTGLCLEVHDGDLIVGGYFTSAGGQAAENIAKWDGTSWSEVAGGLNSIVRALKYWDGDLYVGGDFVGAGPEEVDYLAALDGDHWVGVGTGVDGVVGALGEYGGLLIIGGEFTMAGGQQILHIASWDGSAWSSLGGGINGGPGYVRVKDLAEWDGLLVAVGKFQEAGGEDADNVAFWDGQHWGTFEHGCAGPLSTVIACEGSLVVGGDINYIGGVPCRCFARWTGAGWETFGQGLDRYVSDMMIQDEKLVVVGDFRQGGLIESAYILSWDGDRWISMDGDMGMWSSSNWINAIEFYEDEVVVAGSFTNGWDNLDIDNVAAYDGVSWHPLDKGLEGGGVGVHDLHVHEGLLYAGGIISGTPQGADLSDIAVWDGSSWQDVGGGFDQRVRTFTSLGGDLYAGGYFTTAGGAPANYVARWDGQSWHALGAGLNGYVSKLAVYEGRLIAGGGFTEAGGAEASHMAAWDPVTETWSPLGEGLVPVEDEVVEDMLVVGPLLLVSGRFVMAGGELANCVAYWCNDQWHPIAGSPVGGVRALEYYQDDLYLGGDFTWVDDDEVPSRRIARWNGFANMDVQPFEPTMARLDLGMCRPNPFQTRTRLEFNLASSTPVDVAVYDVLGRRVQTLRAGELTPGEYALHWDGRGESGHQVQTGVYYIRLGLPNESVSRRVLLIR